MPAGGAGETYDVVFVGAGLQNGLIALGLLEARPELSIAMVERDPAPGGNHIWCFHSLDLPRRARPFVTPLVERRWRGYEVRFPRLRRRILAPYSAITSQRLALTLEAAFAARSDCTLLCGRAASRVAADRVVLDDGRALHAPLVIDSRGPSPNGAGAGYQNFLGLELEVEPNRALELPILMDATVEQRDGFRFFYTLPLSERRVLVEDTRFSAHRSFDRSELAREILAYARRMGWRAREIVREESGSLPLPWAGRLPAPTRSPLIGGYRGGWFHPATGYSFPAAVRLACSIQQTAPHQVFGSELRKTVRALRKQIRYAQLLNRMLFCWVAPGQRRNVFEWFYRLPDEVVQRFYAMQMTAVDRARVLIGRPPRGVLSRAIGRRR